MRRISFSLFCFIAFTGSSQELISDSASFYQYVLGKNSSVDLVLKDKKFRVQIVYTQINETKSGEIDLNTINLSTIDYFYPASFVKFPIAILTIEKLNKLGLSLDDILKIEKDFTCGNSTFIDKTNRANLTFRTLIEEMLVVSDNEYYSSLYHFLTPEEINSALFEKGFVNSRIYRAFTGCDVVEQLKCNSIKVVDSKGLIKYEQDATSYDLASMSSRYEYDKKKCIGLKHEYKEEIVEGPYDFNYNLEIPLSEGALMMTRLLHPQCFDQTEIWVITEEQREFLIRALEKYPRELRNAKYHDTNKYPDKIYKYFYIQNYFREPAIRSINKIGLSYGFTTEIGSLSRKNDEKTSILAVSLYTNSNQIVNDGQYEYETVARPFCEGLSKILYDYEEQKSK